MPCEDRLQPVQLYSHSLGQAKACPHSGLLACALCGTGFSLSNSLKACPYSGLVACALCGDRLQPVQLYSYRFKTNAEFFDPNAIVLHTAASTRARRPTSLT